MAPLATLPGYEQRHAAVAHYEQIRNRSPIVSAACTHLATIRAVVPSSQGCEECLRMGASWVHLRMCEACGHVGCCDSSLNRHATAHHRATQHPIITSREPGERWKYCYVDDVVWE